MGNQRVERYLDSVSSRLQGLPPAERDEQIQELRQHLESLVIEHRARGLSDDRAVDAALRQFGSSEKIGGQLRRAWNQHGKQTNKTAYRSAVGVALAAAFILLLPLLAMQITDEVVWDLADFAVAGALLVGAGLTYELAARKTNITAYRSAVGLALAAAFILVWGNLAVGLIGSEDERANLMYIGVLAVGIIGALIARFQPRGMARALFATALAQALVAVIALIAGMHQYPGSSVFEILGLTGFFIALFLGSAWLFRYAAREQHPAGAVQEG